MLKIIQDNFVPFLFLSILGYIAYYLLLSDQNLHVSIAYLIHLTHGLPLKPHLIMLALLPIYISLVVFGAAIVGLYLGALLQKILIKQPKLNPPRFKRTWK